MRGRIGRLVHIERVLVKYGLEEIILRDTRIAGLRHVSVLSPTRWLHSHMRKLPRGQRLRLALEELGPVFVKLGQMLSTRRDLLPDDIGDELALLQDRVAPIPAHVARAEIEAALGQSIATAFDQFEDMPIASASVAQVHGVTLHGGERAIVKVLRPGIAETIERDIGLMYAFADLASRVLRDARRLRPREVVEEYERTIAGELDLVHEAANAMVLRNNFKDSSTLYIPQMYGDFTRRNMLVQERIDGIPIRDIAEMKRIGIDMKKLAEHGVEIFYTQVFTHNFFHADMHPGNIFVSRECPEHPRYIAVDFGIVGSLTDEDLRYIGENLLAFLQRDYRRVAQLHIDSGWVPASTRVSDLEAGIRTVCEPIFEKPLSEISFGNVLLQLFHVARRYEMEVQPQLVLLQKTLLNIEGLGRQLYPELDLWATGKPFLQQWVIERGNPKHMFKRLLEQAPAVLKALPEMPLLLHDFLDLSTRALRETQGAAAGAAPAAGFGVAAGAGARMDSHAGLAGLHLRPTGGASRRAGVSVAAGRVGGGGERSLRWTIAGASLSISAAMLMAAHVIAGGVGMPGWLWGVGTIGVLALLRGLLG